MKRALLYFAHPLGAVSKAGLDLNLAGAVRWFTWLRREFTETTFVAPWIGSVIAGDNDFDPAHREQGLTDACAVIERSDGIVLCGDRLSSGMKVERDHGAKRPAFEVYDLTRFGWGHPSDVLIDGMLHVTFEEWHAQMVFEAAATLKRVR